MTKRTISRYPQTELEIVRVEPSDKRAFNILCASRDLTQMEMFHEMIEFYNRGEGE